MDECSILGASHSPARSGDFRHRGSSKCVAQRHSASQKLAQATGTMGLVGHSGNSQLSHPRRSFSPLRCLHTLGTWIASTRICMSWYHNHTPHQRIPTVHATSPHHDTTPVAATPPFMLHNCDSSRAFTNHDAPAETERAACCERERVQN